jgi:hypothetical protein
MHARNPDIVMLAVALGRTPGSVAMKLVNLASLDPSETSRGVVGLQGASKADRELFEQALADWDGVLGQAMDATARLHEGPVGMTELQLSPPAGPSQVTRSVNVRRLQGFFRDAVLASYDFTCAVSGIRIPQLLTASHIIPWASDETRRIDPRNGIALSSLHDRAFDRGLMTLDEDCRVVVARSLRVRDPSDIHRASLMEIHGRPIRLPTRFRPDPAAIAWHREHVFAD